MICIKLHVRVTLCALYLFSAHPTQTTWSLQSTIKLTMCIKLRMWNADNVDSSTSQLCLINPLQLTWLIHHQQHPSSATSITVTPQSIHHTGIFKQVINQIFKNGCWQWGSSQSQWRKRRYCQQHQDNLTMHKLALPLWCIFSKTKSCMFTFLYNHWIIIIPPKEM